MPKTESVTLELPSEVVASVRRAVERGDYPSVDDAVSDALVHWTPAGGDVGYLRQVWQEAMEDTGPGEPMEDAMDRLEAKYRARYDEAAKKQCV